MPKESNPISQELYAALSEAGIKTTPELITVVDSEGETYIFAPLGTTVSNSLGDAFTFNGEYPGPMFMLCRGLRNSRPYLMCDRYGCRVITIP